MPLPRSSNGDNVVIPYLLSVDDSFWSILLVLKLLHTRILRADFVESTCIHSVYVNTRDYSTYGNCPTECRNNINSLRRYVPTSDVASCPIPLFSRLD
jgi:hypothetical protein